MSEMLAATKGEAAEVSWLRRDVLLFAISIGCSTEELHFIYELHKDFQVFPTFPITLVHKLTHIDVIDYLAQQTEESILGVPKFDYRRVVDGQRFMEFLRPLPVTSEGRNFRLVKKILGVYDKGTPGSVVDTEYTLVDTDTNTVYTRAIGSRFFVGQGSWGGPKGPKTVSHPPPRGRETLPDERCEITVAATAAHLYRLNGDYNPLHATPEQGIKMGFNGAIVHGLFTWNSTAHAILQRLGNSDPSNMREYQARFAAPVRPGDTLVSEMWKTGQFKDGWEEVRFLTKLRNGTVVLSNGRALMKVVAGSSKI